MSEKKSAQELYDEWEKADAELKELRAQYFSIGTPPVELPPRIVTPEALEEIETLERKVDELLQAYYRAV